MTEWEIVLSKVTGVPYICHNKCGRLVIEQESRSSCINCHKKPPQALIHILKSFRIMMERFKLYE